MPEYQIRQDKNGMYYNAPIYSEEELEEMEETRKKKEAKLAEDKIKEDADKIKAKAKK